MAGSNFTNGSLVMRIWRFDGSGDMIAEFQYFSDALSFAKASAEKLSSGQDVFYLAVCDDENKFQCFFRPKTEAST